MLVPVAARATLVADPAVLYAQMKATYAQGSAHGWHFIDQVYYLSQIFDTGRAYSLQMSSDPAYGEVAQLAVAVASGLHYNPLTNHDAAPWYVREAANYVIKSGSPDDAAKAQALLDRVDAMEDPEREARFADEDAAANLASYPGDVEAALQRVEANWRAWRITGDASWRSLAFERAAQAGFPIAKLPTTYGPEFLNAARAAASGGTGYAPGDAANAKALLARLKASGTLTQIASVNGISHDKLMTTLAPADEYFGRTGMSILGMRNELQHLTAMLDAGWGDRESSPAVLLADAVDDLHKVYPRDRDLPDLLLAVYRQLSRIHTTDATTEALHVRTILTVEYQDTQQARSLLAS
ncbi:MAG: hypothetical protein JOZ38_02445 [Candidatus Eremiobacteraeota bacterium]|nr:hypothetical protein [Candidatus Eremiobacteraeota bacterium]